MGGEPTEAVAARKEAEGKAIGGACRHAGRAIEDCFALNKRADKAALFAGWREMNDYMRENKIDAVAPQGGVVAEAVPDKPVEGSAAKKVEPVVADDGAAKKPAKSKKHES
ncbi:MAG: hypothetical protein V4792_07170 [Pseudomonadota bacterium]